MEKIDFLMFSVINNTPFRSKTLDRVMFLLTQLGEGWIIVLLMTGIRYGLGISGPWYAQAMASILAVGVICQIIKKYFPRSRPVTVLPNVHVLGKRLTSGSFPSGHTATSFGLAIILSYHYQELACLFFTAAGLIGLTRVYIGAHFPFDVFWGTVVGLSTTSAMLAFLLAAPDLGIDNPLMAVYGITVTLALSLPFFGGYTYARIKKRLKGKAERLQQLRCQLLKRQSFSNHD